MSFLDSLIGAAPYVKPVVDRAVQRNDTEREKKRQQDLQTAMLQRQASIDDDNRQLHQATIGHLNAETTKLGQPTPRNIDPLSQEGITATVDRDRQVGALKPPAAEPLEVTMSGGKRVYTPRSKAVGAEAPSPAGPQDDRTLVQVQQPDGTVVYMPRSQAAGMQAPGKTGAASLPAPMAAKVGQFGEMLKKSHDLFPSMDALDVKLGGSAAQDVATNGVGVGHARIPGTRGLGSMMLSHTPEYATYQAALTPFVLAAAHALSGARINNEQVNQIRASIELTPGMSPQERTQKRKNLIDLVNSIGGSLPANAIGEQEGQMSPAEIAVLQGYGYKTRGAAKAAGANPPSGDIDLGKPDAAAPSTGTHTVTIGGKKYVVPD